MPVCLETGGTNNKVIKVVHIKIDFMIPQERCRVFGVFVAIISVEVLFWIAHGYWSFFFGMSRVLVG